MLDIYATTAAPSTPRAAHSDAPLAFVSNVGDVAALFAALEQTSTSPVLLETVYRFVDSRHYRAQPLGVAPHAIAHYERAIYQAGPAAIPRIAALLDHPQREVRRAAARMLARHGEVAVEPLLKALDAPLTRPAARDALANIGLPAASSLAGMMRDTTISAGAFAAADAAFSAIAGVVTRREIGRLRRAAVLPWFVGLLMAVAVTTLSINLPIDTAFMVLAAVMAAYFGWAFVVVHDDRYYDVNHHYGWWYDIFTAPFQYRAQLRNLASRAAARIGFERRHRIP